MYTLVFLDLVLFTTGDVTHLLEPEQDRVVIPHIHGVAQDGMERFGHVQVAHTSTGDSGGPCTGFGFVDEKNVTTRPLPPGLELHGEMPGSAQAVDARSDDHIGCRFGQRVGHQVFPFVSCRSVRAQAYR